METRRQVVENTTCNPKGMSGAAENIVVRGVNWLGDAVMTTPALLRLREAKPAARITIITPEKLAGLWKHHPAVDDVIAITPEETAWQVGRRLRWGNFTHGIVFPNSPRSAIELWLGRVPKRIGYRRPWRNIFLTDALPDRSGKAVMRKRSTAEINRRIAENDFSEPDVSPSAHQIHDYLHLTAAVGASAEAVAPKISVTEEETRNLRRLLLHDQDTGREIFAGLNPGAEYGSAKRWPKDRFIETAIAVQKQTGCHWLIFGGKNDLALTEEIALGIRTANGRATVTNLAGKTSLRELCVALKLCRVLLTNDTGPAHVGAAVGTRVVIPFGSTSPILTAPGFPDLASHRFISGQAACAPCFLRECPVDFRCMKSIASQAVTEALLASLHYSTKAM